MFYLFIFVFFENNFFSCIIYPNNVFSLPLHLPAPLALPSGPIPFLSLITKSTGFYEIITKYNNIIYDVIKQKLTHQNCTKQTNRRKKMQEKAQETDTHLFCTPRYSVKLLSWKPDYICRAHSSSAGFPEP